MEALSIPLGTTETPVDDGSKVLSGEGAEVTQVTISDKPAPADKKEEKLFAGKFKTTDDLEKAYTELQTKLGTQKSDKETAKPEVPVTKKVEESGLDLNALAQDYTKNGNKVSDDTYAKFAAKGIDKASVDAYVEGQKALAEKYTSDVAKAVGGVEEMTALLGWAKTSLTDAEKTTINKALASGDAALAGLALQGLNARFAAERGTTPARVKGESAPSVSGIQPFKSNNEVVAAMQDPRYTKDEAYRQEVYERLKVS